MSLETHRAAIVALLGTVPEVGRVHAFQRFAREENAFRAHYLHTLPNGAQQLRGWQVSNAAVRERELGVGRWFNEFEWDVRGYLALDDAEQTEITFDSLVEEFRTRFRADPTMGGVSAAERLDIDDGVQKLSAGHVLFCSVLCHTAQLKLRTTEYL